MRHACSMHAAYMCGIHATYMQHTMLQHKSNTQAALVVRHALGLDQSNRTHGIFNSTTKPVSRTCSVGELCEKSAAQIALSAFAVKANRQLEVVVRMSEPLRAAVKSWFERHDTLKHYAPVLADAALYTVALLPVTMLLMYERSHAYVCTCAHARAHAHMRTRTHMHAHMHGTARHGTDWHSTAQHGTARMHARTCMHA